ncbi:hypothetical protein PPTG_23981 [Phytophthora nicotianae INRA-310]|uniref:Uncharacterized protein n=3 Tax=Phytophthora nicotianae TaxID=4792 RepID=W2PMQ5_PHYN3|nr:hypothetical protein PPTG_23981 [Phytophthora nicotianae INRA-310]ETI35495.1 hypothetical protein F443_18163 [Phytophthora nicotianae P1569]ETN01901.1 hypothetical protein PPTG_23981 [Phytophthora nicotianae INRA-310]ETO64234.1 hypothetical protein F444_18187 [Phytophthora nicotianae P1976]
MKQDFGGRYSSGPDMRKMYQSCMFNARTTSKRLCVAAVTGRSEMTTKRRQHRTCRTQDGSGWAGLMTSGASKHRAFLR